MSKQEVETVFENAYINRARMKGVHVLSQILKRCTIGRSTC